jgi:hypothetical protein
MVHIDELSDEFFYCPICEFPLSLLRRTHSKTGEMAILVTCEGCDPYHGFVILTGIKEMDLKKFTKFNNKTHSAEIEGFEFGY